MFQFLKYYTWDKAFSYMFQFLLFKLKMKNSWNLYDKNNFLISKIQLKFNLESNLFNSTIFIKELSKSIRKNSSDLEVVEQIWLNQEYLKPIEIIEQHFSINDPTIFDIGANIGMASLYFKHKFPNASVFAFEPFESNRNQISKQFTISPKALWKSNCTLKTSMEFRDGKEWSVQVQEDTKGNIAGARLLSLLKDYSIEVIDILKMDIEGSEYPVFLEDPTITEALTHVKSIVIEIHDDAGNRNDLYAKLKECNFKNYPLGELDVFINEKFIT